MVPVVWHFSALYVSIILMAYEFFYQFFSSDIVDFFSDNDYSKKMVKGVRTMNFFEAADRDFSISVLRIQLFKP